MCATPIVGFENHAGRTLLGAGEKPLGRALVAGTGNNGEDGGEGVQHDGVIGTYLHGPILPKNPGVTDWLIARALARRGEPVELAPLDDALETARARRRTAHLAQITRKSLHRFSRQLGTSEKGLQICVLLMAGEKDVPPATQNGPRRSAGGRSSDYDVSAYASA